MSIHVVPMRPEDWPSVREVGRRERLGALQGVWRDVVLLERRRPLVEG